MYALTIATSTVCNDIPSIHLHTRPNLFHKNIRDRRMQIGTITKDYSTAYEWFFGHVIDLLPAVTNRFVTMQRNVTAAKSRSVCNIFAIALCHDITCLSIILRTGHPEMNAFFFEDVLRGALCNILYVISKFYYLKTIRLRKMGFSLLLNSIHC